MYKRIFVVLFAALFAFAVAGAVTAASKSTSTTYTKVAGTVSKIDSATHDITLQTGTETKTVHYNNATTFMHKGKKVKAASLKENDQVTVYVDSKSDAHRIEITAAGSPAKSR